MQTKSLNFNNNREQDLKTIFLTSIGGMLEFYDFIIFSLFAITLGKTFFPSQNSLALDALSAFSVFAMGYFARPIGGILFGHIGDKYGRKKSFLLTILSMGIASFLIAIIPSYQSIGVIATLLFVILRMIQGAAIGGEIPSAVVFIKETFPKKSGLACGIIFCLINFGIFLGEITKSITTHFFSDSYAWRISFMLGGIAAILSFFLRKEIHETNIFLTKKYNYNVPIIALLRSKKLAILKAISAIAILSIVIGFYSLFLPTYFSLNNVINSESIILINLFLFSIICIPAGIVADKLGTLPILTIGAIGLLVFGPLFYICIINKSPYLIYIMCINDIFMGMVVAVAANYASTLFGSSIRASGLGLSYNISFAVLNGMFLALASYLIAKGIILTPVYLSFVVIIISLAILFLLKNKIVH